MTAAIEAMKPSANLCPGDLANAFTCGLGLAHMDAHLRDNEEAARLFDRDLREVMAERGVKVSLL